MKPLNQYPKHKRKAIKYIRDKFGIAKGLIRVSSYQKISTEVKEQHIKTVTEELIHNLRKNTFSKYKCVLMYTQVSMAQIGDDFLKDLHTIRIVGFNKFTR